MTEVRTALDALAQLLFAMGGVTKEQARDHAAVAIELLAEQDFYIVHQPGDGAPIPSWDEDRVRQRLGLRAGLSPDQDQRNDREIGAE